MRVLKGIHHDLILKAQLGTEQTNKLHKVVIHFEITAQSAILRPALNCAPQI